jgi:hypothetical protein
MWLLVEEIREWILVEDKEPILHSLAFFLISIGNVASAMAATLFMWTHEIGGVSRASELTEIEGFDRAVPNAMAMAGNEEAPSAIAQEIEAAAHSPLGSPAAPPGLTELVLARDDASLRTIRNQLRTTRSVDLGMTVVSFVAFILGVGLCFWQIWSTEKIAQSLVSAGGSGLVGLFCFYATGRARSSQIALALFESLVAELSLSLKAAARAIDEQREQLEHAAWRAFRVELNALYLLERDKGNKQKPAKS